MPLEKITSQQMDAKGVCAAPDILNGTTAENKAIFDRMVRELIAPAYNACVDLVNTLDTAEDQREEAEALRKSAEELRISAETARQNAESGRLTAEQIRADAEKLRATAEQLRSDAEELRASAEQTRITNETARSTAESGRTVEEAKRVTAEKNRLTAEQARVAAETQRDAEETERQSKSSAMQVWEEYDSARAYVPLNKVVWNGSSYICIQACTGVTPDNGNYWLMIARKGVDGTTVSASGQYSFAVENGHLILYYTGDTPPDFSIDESGHLILHFDDTHTMDIGAVIGPPGPAGLGVPAGGTAGQVLTKSSSDDYATEWKDASAGSGSGNGSSYTLPIASPTVLGGVQPVDKTDAMTQSVGVDDSGALWAPPGSGGLSSDEKALIFALFQNAVFNDIDMSATLNQLKNLFNGGEPNTYSVTYNLTDVTSNNNAEVAKEAFPFTATLTVADGLEINKSTLSVTMGGVDITDSVYADGVITIPIVTGDIVITAETLEEGLIYALGKEVVFDGTNSVDTGIHLFDRYKNFTLVYEFTSSSMAGLVFNEYVDGSTNINNEEFAMQRWGDGNWMIKGFGNARRNIGVTGDAINMKCVVMLTSSSAGTVYFSNNNSDVATASFATKDVNNVVGKTATLGLGRGLHGDNSGFIGTIHQFKVYEKILDEATINTFMGVN